MPNKTPNHADNLQDKITQLREILHEVVHHPEVRADRDRAMEVKGHISRNLGLLNAAHGLKRNSSNGRRARTDDIDSK